MSPDDVAATFGVDFYHRGTVVDDLHTAMEAGVAHGVRWAPRVVRNLDVWFVGEQIHVDIPITYSVDGPPHEELLEVRWGSPWQAVGRHHDGYWADDLLAAVRVMERDGWVLEAFGLDEHGAIDRFANLIPAGGGTRVELVDVARRAELHSWLGITADPMPVVRRHLAAVEAGDPVAMAADYAADAVLLRDREYRGRDAIEAYFGTVGERLGGGRVTFDVVVASPRSPDTVTVRWRIVGGPAHATSGTDTIVVTGDAIVRQTVRLDADDF